MTYFFLLVEYLVLIADLKRNVKNNVKEHPWFHISEITIVTTLGSYCINRGTHNSDPPVV